MSLEIERKFLVKGDFKTQAYNKVRITQGYLSSVSERSVRVRVKGEKAYITVKGKSNSTGTSRFEWEKEISVEEGKELLSICEPGIIDKIRYFIQTDHHLYEVDEFLGINEGLTIAEIELQDENEIFPKPDWLGEEVTGEAKYYNAMLSRHPYTTW